MEPITDHMRNVSLNHRAAEAAMASARSDEPASNGVDGSSRPPMKSEATEFGGSAKTGAAKSGSTGKDGKDKVMD